MRALGRTLLILALVFVLVPGAWADDPPLREGFWIGFGLGYGSANMTCDRVACEHDRQGSVTGSLRLGGTVKPNVLAGLDANIWVKSGEEDTTTIGILAAAVTFYPLGSSGFFIKGGLGLSFASRDTEVGSRLEYLVGDTVRFRKTGAGILAGLGYDIRVARTVSITSSLTWYYGSTGTATVNDIAVPGTSHNVLDFGLAVTFH